MVGLGLCTAPHTRLVLGVQSTKQGRQLCLEGAPVAIRHVPSQACNAEYMPHDAPRPPGRAGVRKSHHRCARARTHACTRTHAHAHARAQAQEARRTPGPTHAPRKGVQEAAARAAGHAGQGRDEGGGQGGCPLVAAGQGRAARAGTCGCGEVGGGERGGHERSEVEQAGPPQQEEGEQNRPRASKEVEPGVITP